MRKSTYLFIALISAGLFLGSCKKDPPLVAPNKGYPREVADLILGNCAVSGCHIAESRAAAGGLNLESWEMLFEGSNGGSAVIPYRPEHSYFTFFLNTDADSGISLEPTMPFNGTPFSKSQIQTIVDWIALGAPNDEGQVKFAGNPSRKKFYVANQGCDLVAVIDAESGQIMRYVDIGIQTVSIESPHMLRVSPDGRYWYVVFLFGNPNVEIYDASTDQLVDRIEIGSGDWNTFSMTPDGTLGFAVAYNGKEVAVVDLVNRLYLGRIITSQLPHGSAVHPTLKRLYLTQQVGDGLYRLDWTTDPTQPEEFEEIELLQGVFPAEGSRFDPHELVFSPDGSRYMVTCQGTREVRIFNGVNDQLLANIQVGDMPSEMDIDPQSGFVFVTCMEDIHSFATEPEKRGSVAVIDYNSLSLVATIYTGYQPHGLVVDAEAREVRVLNRNSAAAGPAPHHSSECGGRNGYLTVIDINTLALKPDGRLELSVDPYSIALRK